ncbi:uncharacterized protein M6B38_158635 [Iris pallida]|uniref:Uncharacterized protein n=1 Tax=Iris pallida TaxID=29817 RepID=A0AAX6F261_IRIPA|nr:uncharacterized protein M6B38_158635 [Iris pallida]
MEEGEEINKYMNSVELLAENRSLMTKREALESGVSVLEREKEDPGIRVRVSDVCKLERTCEELGAKLSTSEAENSTLESRCEELESRVSVLEREKKELREEFGAKFSTLEADKWGLESRCEELEAVVLLLEDEVGSSARKLAEEEVAKKRLEEEVSLWKRRCQELETRVSELEKGGKMPPHIVEIDDDSNSEEDLLKILTPNRHRVSKLVLSDSEEEEEEDDDNTPIAKLMKRWNNKEADRKTHKRKLIRRNEEEEEEDGDNTPIAKLMNRWNNKEADQKTHKRKLIRRNSENELDDDIPIGKHKRPRTEDVEEEREECKPPESVTPRRRLVRSGERGAPIGDLVARNLSHTKTSGKYPKERSTVSRKLRYFCLDSGEEEEGDDTELDSDGGTMDEFIVSESDTSETCPDTSGSLQAPNVSVDTSDEESKTSDVEVALGNVLDKYYRKVDVKGWKYESDMLASFGKDPELCMTAVCVLYRQQTAEEQELVATIEANGRGFSQFDAVKGSLIAEFLLDGDKHGPLKKSVQELEAHYPEGLDYCRRLAYRYSKQLFTIYQQKEDPYFLS